ncbi:uncharacterized protein LOC144457777 [Phascolarctos cinereus]
MNPVSNSSHTVLASELCAGIEHGISYIRVLLYLMMTIVLVITLPLLGLSFWYIQRKKEKGPAFLTAALQHSPENILMKADAGDQECTTYESISNPSPDATENPEYATVSYPKKNIQKDLEALHTIYDILQNTTKMDKSDALEKNPGSLGTLGFSNII